MTVELGKRDGQKNAPTGSNARGSARMRSANMPQMWGMDVEQIRQLSTSENAQGCGAITAESQTLCDE